jgi:hypothetical protein
VACESRSPRTNPRVGALGTGLVGRGGADWACAGRQQGLGQWRASPAVGAGSPASVPWTGFLRCQDDGVDHPGLPFPLAGAAEPVASEAERECAHRSSGSRRAFAYRVGVGIRIVIPGWIPVFFTVGFQA